MHLSIDYQNLDAEIAAHIARKQAEGAIPANFDGKAWYSAGFWAGVCFAQRQLQKQVEAEKEVA